MPPVDHYGVESPLRKATANLGRVAPPEPVNAWRFSDIFEKKVLVSFEYVDVPSELDAEPRFGLVHWRGAMGKENRQI